MESETSFFAWVAGPGGSGSRGWQAPEQLTDGRQTRAVDMFTLGCVLFFCITGGQHPFGEHYHRDYNIANGKADLFCIEDMPEVHHLIQALLNHDASKRCKKHTALKFVFHVVDYDEVPFCICKQTDVFLKMRAF
jgi:serine/threonine-protein kinase/endoribonuclease IRE1